jgi:hypothetical protein
MMARIEITDIELDAYQEVVGEVADIEAAEAVRASECKRLGAHWSEIEVDEDSDDAVVVIRLACNGKLGGPDGLREALRWALGQIEDSLDHGHQVALAVARQALAEADAAAVGL